MQPQKVGHYTVTVTRDLDPPNPRDYPNNTLIAIWDEPYEIGDGAGFTPFGADRWYWSPLFLSDEGGRLHLVIGKRTGYRHCGNIWFPRRLSREIRDAELQAYNHFLAGDTWKYVITDDEGRELDVGLGYYGAAEDCMDAGVEQAEASEPLWNLARGRGYVTTI